ncbi:MAG: hypothetical protein EXS41_10735, partial [Opitutaceae bacterium]|nr:hypothetical protein [Opitutaceae bacterium]
MKGRWIWLVIFLLPAGGAGYMTWLSWQAGDSGKWLFGVFTLFFLALAAEFRLRDKVIPAHPLKIEPDGTLRLEKPLESRESLRLTFRPDQGRVTAI